MLQVWASLGAGLDPKMLAAGSLVCLVGLFLTLTLLGRAFASAAQQAAWVALSAIGGGAVIWAAHFVAMTAYHPQLQSGYDPVRTTFAFMTALAGMTASFWAAAGGRRAWSPALAGGLFGIGVTAAMAAGLNAFQTQGVLMWSSLSLLKSTPVSVLLATAAFMIGRDMQGWKRPMAAAPLLFGAVAMVHLAATNGITVSGDPSIALPGRLIAPEVLAVLATFVAVLTIGAGHLVSDRGAVARAIQEPTPEPLPAVEAEAEPDRSAAPAPAPTPTRTDGALLASLGGDILTQLNGLAARTGMLARSELQPSQREIVEALGASTAALQRQMAEMVDMARIEQGQLAIRREALSIAETIGQIAGLAEQRAADRSLGFRLELDAASDRRVVGDRDRIAQMALNLVDHALASIDGGEVALKVSPGRAQDALRFEVRAAGFSTEEKPRGSSLALAHRLSSLMGGTADTPVVEGAGASYGVELPLPETMEAVETPSEPQAVAAKPPPAEPARLIRVLLAEGDPSHRKAIELLLKATGADVTSVEDGPLLVQTFGAAHFDLIMIDAQLPVMDGLAAMRIIRELERLRSLAHTPAIVLCAPAQANQPEPSFDAGADAHISKPLTAAILGPAIERLLQEAAIQPAAQAPVQAGAAA